MAKDTVTLPALPADQAYVAVPVSIVFHIDGAKKVSTDYAFNLGGDNGLTPNLIAKAIRQGLVRWVGTATTSLKRDSEGNPIETEKEACDNRAESISNGSYVPGQGGGSRRDMKTVVLEEMTIPVVMHNLNLKKVEATKLVKKGCESAFRLASKKRAESLGKTVEEVFDATWPKFSAKAEAEATRRTEAQSEFDPFDVE